MTPSNEAHVDLEVTGMTCAACAARIERRLNKLDGVRASVNYATEKASIDFDATQVTPEVLVDAVEAIGYGASPSVDLAICDHDGSDAIDDESTPAERNAAARLADLRHRLAVSAALSAPVLVLSMAPALQFDRWQWLVLMLAAPVAVWGAWPFHRAAALNARHRTATMDTLVSLGVLAAFGWSLWALFIGDAGRPGMKMPFDLWPGRDGGAGTTAPTDHGQMPAAQGASGHDEIYLEVASIVVVFLLAGRYLEAKARRRAGAAVRALLRLGARDATVLRDGAETRVPIEALAVGEQFLVRPGEKIATDGIVEQGSSAVDASLVTGESTPVEVTAGDAVTGGTVNVGGRLVVRATRVGHDTVLAQIARLVEQAQSGKAPVQRLADRVSAVFVPVVIAVAVATWVAWAIATGDLDDAVTAAVSVLIIACPCALGLATPTALLVGTGRGAQMGIIIRGPEVLESTRRADTIVLDKTGTLTSGQMQVVDVIAAEGENAVEVLRRAGAAETSSEHPIARAVVAAARDHGDLAVVAHFSSEAGLGVLADVATPSGTSTVVVGRRQFLVERGVAVPPALADRMAVAESQGATVVVVGWDGSARGAVVVADTVKPSSPAAVAALRGLGLRPLLLTGDNAATARSVAREVGIDEADVVSDVLPADKVDVVQRLQADGAVVAMAGDGVNDAAALAQADLGIAMGTGADAAIEASDLTIVGGDLRAAADAIRLSRRTLATIKGNLFWAFAYNVAAIPLAAGGFLNPLIAGLAMALSSVFVVTNSLRLRRFGR